MRLRQSQLTGAFVAFVTGTPNAVSRDTNHAADVFVRNMLTGTTRLASVGSGGTQAALGGNSPSVSGDGRYVAFPSLSPDLVAHDTNDAADIFVWDQRTHVTRRVSVFPGSVQSEGSTNRGYSRHASISAGGRFVAFGSIATNLVRNDTNNFYDVFVRDRRAHTTRRVSVGPGGAQANGTCLHLAMSANGRHVTFDSFASNLVSPERRHHELQAFVNQRER